MKCFILSTIIALVIQQIVSFLMRKFAFVLKVNKKHQYQMNIMHNKVHIYYINMDKSIQRNEYILSNLNKMNFDYSRIPGVDGIQMTNKEIENFVDIDLFIRLRGKELSKGEVGCYKSHLLAWQNFLNSDSEFGLICEDDISFDPKELQEKILQLISKDNSKLWDICSFQLKHLGLPIKIKNLDKNSAIVTYLGHCVEAGCYLINRKCANLLVNNAVKMIMPLDYYYNRPFEFDLKFVGIEPRIVHQTFGTSEIGETKSKIKKINQMDIKIYKKLYRFFSAICRVSYNIKQIIMLKIALKIQAIQKTIKYIIRIK